MAKRPKHLRKVLNLQEGDRLITAYAERAAGPGWTNSPIWVVICSKAGEWREECIQPEERTRDLHALYDVAASAHASLMGSIRAGLAAVVEK